MSRNDALLVEAHESLNRQLTSTWADVAPGVPINLGPNEGAPQAFAPPALYVHWMRFGDDVRGVTEGMVQLSVYAPQLDDALTWAAKLSAALGVGAGLVSGLVGVFDYTQDPPWQVGEMRLAQLEKGWVRVPQPNGDSTTHLALTLLPRWRQIATRPTTPTP